MLGKYEMIALGLGGGTASSVAGMLSTYKSTEVVVSEADTKDVGAQTPTEQEDKGDSVSGFESPQDATTSEEGATSESVSEGDGVTAQQPSLGQEMGVQDPDLDVEEIKSTTADSETGDNADGKVNQADSDELGTPSLQKYDDLQVQGTPTNAEGGETSDIPLGDKKDSEGPKVDPTTKQIAEPKSNVKIVSAQEPVSSVPVASTPQITTISP
ncbi:hypothetical protein OVS_04205 [Mycoplasma ovis str. Michigan]|uniref:Uncharacterized protein n=1 Tax=Mycoplasma ovis str. Michigan TaxID=1415773 RepID=A0ABN4BSN7_9MOLU|nr:hypothetical protein [Mycoplasma ovis]AHC40568.1 hypothetical protein OVS_04205 [Mycoplasma ovis str. Michigan]